MKNRTRFFAAIAVLALVVAACGDGSGEGTTTTAGGGAELELKTPGTLTVCTDVPYPPMEFIQDGEYTGFDMELMKAIAEDLGPSSPSPNRAGRPSPVVSLSRPSVTSPQLPSPSPKSAPRTSTSPTPTSRRSSRCW